MAFQDFARREGLLDLATLTRGAWEAVEELVAAGHAPEDVLDELPSELGKLPGRMVRSVLAVWRRYLQWGEARDEIASRRSGAGLPPLPEAVVQRAAQVSLLHALDAAADVLPFERFPDEESWERALGAAIDLWSRCLALARRDGSVEATLDEAHGDADDYADHAGGAQPLDELPPHRWMALRRGERIGALALDFAVPQEPIREQLELAREALGPALDGENDDAILTALVFDRLPAGLRGELDAEAGRQAIGAAAEAYADLLGSAPLSADRVAGIYVGAMKRPIGLAAIDRTGQVRSTARIAPTADWVERVRAWLSSEEVSHVVVPAQASAQASLSELRRELSRGVTVTTVVPAGLAEARDAILEARPGMVREAAAAAVLAQRAAAPAQAWSTVDPLRLGLAEYQADLDTDTLSAELAVTRALVLRALPSRPLPRRVGRRRAAAPVTRQSNPLVRSIGDLRPGMSVAATVTNVTRFGAFVDLGLSQQGLIHVSDLADHFVRDPGEVVRPGQEVQAHVVNIDVSRGRISLSLRTPAGGQSGGPRRAGIGSSSTPRSSSPPSGGSGRPNRRVGGSERAKALRDLDKLFDR